VKGRLLRAIIGLIHGTSVAKAREAGLYTRESGLPGAKFYVKAASLWREIIEERPSGIRYLKLRYWMRTCVLGLTADEPGVALVALLCGCWWAAPMGRQQTPAGDYARSVCGACGATSGNLVVHLLCGACGAEAACSCATAASYRREWQSEVAGLYAEHPGTAAAAAFAAAPPCSERRLALSLGHAAGVELPWGLASALPSAFVRAWGAWSEAALEQAALVAAAGAG
jgi:hypothetical protein